MKILLTGSCGFIGIHTKECLLKNGHEVIDYDLILNKDILNLQQLEADISNADFVIHLAAQANLYAMTDISTIHSNANFNVQGTHNIAFICSKHKKPLIYGSTMCVYGNAGYTDEDKTIPSPTEIYAYTKLAGEEIVKGYHASFNLDYIILRFATVYGPYQRAPLGTSIFFKQALNNQNLSVHGDGTQTRTMTYVGDLAKGIVKSVKHFEKAKKQTINLTSDKSISALQMAQDIIKITNSNSKIEHIAQRPNQIMHEIPCTSKANELLNWCADTSWNDGLYLTLNWIKNHV